MTTARKVIGAIIIVLIIIGIWLGATGRIVMPSVNPPQPDRIAELEKKIEEQQRAAAAAEQARKDKEVADAKAKADAEAAEKARKEKEATDANIAKLERELEEAKKAPDVTLPPGGVTPGMATPPAPAPGFAPAPQYAGTAPQPSAPGAIQSSVGPINPAFRPASPDRRFLEVPDPAIMNGNPDGSTAVQWTDDVGIIYPRPAGPDYTREQILAAAKRVPGLDALAIENQKGPIDGYVLADWPSTEPRLDSSGRQVVVPGPNGTMIPQVVMYKVLKSPNVTTIRHKDDVPGASGMAGKVGPVLRQPQAAAPSTVPSQTPRVTLARPATAGKLVPSGKDDFCPTCNEPVRNAPVRPFQCQRCGNMLQ
jgi:hypothetical protein